MAEIPRSILSEHFQEQMGDRRLVSAVFVTYRFDPAFFEQEVLPVFLDISLSHASKIRLVQLEDAMREIPVGVAVYYDQNGLESGDSAKLDIRRCAVRFQNGFIFHPKNVFALVEEKEPDEDGHRARALIAGCMSANITRAGWWENVEVCHTEEIQEGDSTRIRDDLLDYLDKLKVLSGDRAAGGHEAIDSIMHFLRETEQKPRKKSEGFLNTHFFHGQAGFIEFLRNTAGSDLNDMYLEIISPYFDAGPESIPLRDLMRSFSPREVRVLLPLKDDGETGCSEEIFEWIREQPRVSWGSLPRDILQRGKRKDVKERFVHAKVYRFFKQHPKKEIMFVGSVNLTKAAHKKGGNLETGFLVQTDSPRRPEWWLKVHDSHPVKFEHSREDEGSALGGTRLSLLYRWNTSSAEAYWDDEAPSPRLRVEHQGVPLFELDTLPPMEWETLDPDISAELGKVLISTSMLIVYEDGDSPGLLLVQEEGMSHRPSILFDLTPAEILRYWSLLTVEQRAAFLEHRAPQTALEGEGEALVTILPLVEDHDTLFDRFAGIFHAFGCLERKVRDALENDRRNEATYLVFGQKYDSLGSFLSRVLREGADGKGDIVEHYVIFLCARQLLSGLKREFSDFWQDHGEDWKQLRAQLDEAGRIREQIVARNPGEMPAFLEWFDKWFLRRASGMDRGEPS